MRLKTSVLLPWAGFLVACCVAASPRVAAAEDDVDWGFQGSSGDADAPGDEPDGDGPAAPDNDVALELPARVLLRLGAGAAVRLGTGEQYGRDDLAPFYLEVMGGFVAPGSGRWRHGATLNVSTNLTDDGPASENTGAFGQYTFIASYLAYFRFGMDLVVGARIGPLVNIGFADTVQDTKFDWSWGGEVAAHVQYMLLAGFGLYADLGVSVFAGAAKDVFPIAAVSAGVVIDYELLP